MQEPTVSTISSNISIKGIGAIAEMKKECGSSIYNRKFKLQEAISTVELFKKNNLVTQGS